MEERATLRTLIAELLGGPLVRIGGLLFAVLLLVWGAFWFFSSYRPEAYLRRAYPAWREFETAVDDARNGDYRYDPYGVLELNLERVEAAAQDAAKKLPEVSPPRAFRDLHAASLAVIGQYLDAGKNFSTDLKTESDYYYTLLVHLRNLFGFADARATVLRTRAGDNGSQYEDTFRQYQVLSAELSKLLTRAQVAKIPARLKEYHAGLLASLSDIEKTARQGVDEFVDFQLEMGKESHVSAASHLASFEATTLAKTMSGIAATDDSMTASALSEIEGLTSGTSYSKYFQQSTQRILDEQRQFALMLDYADFLRDMRGFYEKYDRFGPPRLTALTGIASLVETGNAGTYAAQWNTYLGMTDALEELAFAAGGAVPPAQYKDFHAQALAVVKEALASAQEAAGAFEVFNVTITDHRFRDLDRKIEDAAALAARDLDFADLWNLKDLAQGDAAVAASFEAVKSSWREALVKYELQP